MALLNKLGEIVKSAAEKTEELTKTLGEKAEAALEIQRLNSQVNKERSKISDTHKKIGEILWAKFEAGEEIPEEFKEHCTAISEALTKIDEHKVAIAKIKATAFAGEEPKTSCPSCGAQVTLNSKFCGECGGKMPVHEPEPVEEEAAPLTETVHTVPAVGVLRRHSRSGQRFSALPAGSSRRRTFPGRRWSPGVRSASPGSADPGHHAPAASAGSPPDRQCGLFSSVPESCFHG